MANRNGRWMSFADRFSMLWLATLTVAAATYLGLAEVLSSDAVAGLLGSVLALAGGQAIRRQADIAAHENGNRPRT